MIIYPGNVAVCWVGFPKLKLDPRFGALKPLKPGADVVGVEKNPVCPVAATLAVVAVGAPNEKELPAAPKLYN